MFESWRCQIITGARKLGFMTAELSIQNVPELKLVGNGPIDMVLSRGPQPGRKIVARWPQNLLPNWQQAPELTPRLQKGGNSAILVSPTSKSELTFQLKKGGESAIQQKSDSDTIGNS